VTPPNDLSEKIIKEIQRLSILAHEALGCSHISRADFILEDNILYILEVNTIPGMTQNSLLPKGARAIGMDFPRLLETIIRVALQ
jgi:D-alanine-D-alanine ligase